MANRLFSPNQQYADTTGLPYAGGSLSFYASGTSTPLATYSNRALTIANTNPVVLDSAGRAGDIFLQNLAYKVVLASDALGLVPIWTADPVYSSDFSTTASFLSGAGSPNGVVAGSQGSPTVPASVYWDTTNNILYVCTTTGNAATAVWTAVNASTAAAVVPAPQGYLTLTSGVPIIPSDVTAATTVYYTPYVGNLAPIYNGASFNPAVFAELQLSLVASHAANNIYDVFIFNNSGVPTLVTGPSWSAGTSGSITAGSCARGTGAGGTALSRVNGILTNAVQISARNGSTTYTINANLATYLGSIFMDGTNGQISCHRAFGQNRKWGVWNAYNRQTISLQAGDSTASWSYNTGTIRASNATPSAYSAAAFNFGSGTACNGGVIFAGLAEEEAALSFSQSVTLASNNTVPSAHVYIGINSTTAGSGKAGRVLYQPPAVASTTNTFDALALYGLPPALGLTNFSSLENGDGSTGTTTFIGTAASMILSASYRG